MIDQALFWDMVRSGRRVTGLDRPSPDQLDAAEAAQVYLICLMEPIDPTVLDELRAADHRPKPALQKIAQDYPQVAWLALLAPAERSWYAEPERRDRLLSELEGVPIPVWTVLLPTRSR